MKTKERGRRQFLKEAALAGLAVGIGRSASGQTARSETPAANRKDLRYGERSRFVTTVRIRSKENNLALNPVQDSMGIITPSALDYTAGIKFDGPERIPDIDPRQHRLMIHGLVDRPLIFTMEDLQRLPSVSRILFVECAGNGSPSHLEVKNAKSVQQTHGEMSCSEWTGVPLSLLLKEAGVQKGASWLVAEGADPNKHTRSFPLAKAMDDVIVAYGQNGEPVRPEQGYPLRLVLPGWEGNINVKWLRRIKVVDQAYMAKNESVGYTSLRPDGKARWFQFEMGPNSVITFPSVGQQLPSHGFYEIRGLAWSGGGAVRRAEVSTDGGKTWKDAQLQEPVMRMSHTRFRLPWNWGGEEAVLQSRCTDERGNVQPTAAEISKIWGVGLDYWATTSNQVNHFNAIFPWRVTREGSVQNAIL